SAVLSVRNIASSPDRVFLLRRRYYAGTGACPWDEARTVVEFAPEIRPAVDGPQLEDGEGSRFRRAADVPSARRRGDQIAAFLLRCVSPVMVLLWRAHWLGKIGEKVRTVPQDAAFEARRYLEAREPDVGRDRDPHRPDEG